MVAMTGRYHIFPIEIFQGVTQGNPLLPNIFNILMDAVMHHWVMLVVYEKVVPEGLRWLIHHIEAYLYVGDGLNMSAQAGRLQWYFNVLPYLFDRVGLRANIQKRRAWFFNRAITLAACMWRNTHAEWPGRVKRIGIS